WGFLAARRRGGKARRERAPRAGAIPADRPLVAGWSARAEWVEIQRGIARSSRTDPGAVFTSSWRRYAMNTYLGDRNIPTSLLVGAPLLLAGSAATFLFYRSGSD